MKLPDRKVTFGLIVGTRGFFNPRLAQEGRAQMEAQLKRLGYDCVILPAEATKHGAIESRADAQKCAKLFQSRREEIDGIIVVLPNFGDELGVVPPPIVGPHLQKRLRAPRGHGPHALCRSAGGGRVQVPPMGSL